ncbi:MAG: 16S rRNA (cytosine(1402)-N(4))-methyltransferase [Flavobacteriales bacterium TMED123]|nr:MAG: 16S rRNA (cytosine(1402)-N(4))-methyltransferase [Flavobacteriales bacterium TMED123]
MYHEAVLLNESVQGLNIKPNGFYVDVTFGAGGHSKAILALLESGKLFAFDQDTDTSKNILEHQNFKLLKTNFRNIKNFLRIEGVNKIDGLLADLGVSSHQFDVGERGFSTRFDGPLDMRMNLNAELDAKYIINNYSEEKLANLFFEYGEMRASRKIARAIVGVRKKIPIETTKQLIECVKYLLPERKLNQFLAKIFQAIRIEVNDEINALKQMLKATTDLLATGGRLSVISYHSLEDRVVKNLIKKGNVEGELQKDFYGNQKKSFKEISKKVIVPSDQDIKENPRARSARLRIAEKL